MVELGKGDRVCEHKAVMDVSICNCVLGPFFLLLFSQFFDWSVFVFILLQSIVKGSELVEHDRSLALHIGPRRPNRLSWQNLGQVCSFGILNILIHLKVRHNLRRVAGERCLQVPMNFADQSAKSLLFETEREELILHQDGLQVRQHFS